MKKLIALVLSLILCFGVFFVTPVSANNIVRGDVCVDGIVDVKDLLVLRKYVSKLVSLTDSLFENADCNGDKLVNIEDVLIMRKHLIKEAEFYKEPGWETILNWENETVNKCPKYVTIVPAVIATVTELNSNYNSKNPTSAKSLALKSGGLYYQDSVKGSNPTCSYNISTNAPTRIQIIANNSDALLQNSTNLRLSMKYQPVQDELSVAYIGFSFKSLTNFYYTRITLESYSDFNYFYFVGKEYCKVDTKNATRRTFLSDEAVERITLTKQDIPNIKSICFWLESDKGTYGAPFYVDDIQHFTGADGYDSSNEDANLKQPEELIDDGKDKYIAISFDDGPQTYSPTGKHYMEYYLDVAKEYNAKFSYFLIGSNCGEDDIPVLKRAVEEGHALENHTIAHNRLSNLTAEEGASKITEFDEWLYNNVGVKTKYIRPPYLGVNENAYSAMRLAGMKAAIGGPCPQDYNNPSVDYKELYYKKHLYDGVISLNHEQYIDNVETIRRLLEYFSALGYEFVTIDELFKIKGVTPTLDKVYYTVND